MENSKYLVEMSEIFYHDTIALFNRLVRQEKSDTAVSAAAVYDRLNIVVQVQNIYYHKKFKSVKEFLLQLGYTEEEIQAFKAMRQKENDAI